MMTTVKIALTTPIQAHGAEVKELELTKPTGVHVRKFGMPTKVEITKSGAQMQVVDMDSVANYVSALAQIPPSSVDQIDPCDWPELAAAITNFFNREAKSSTATTS